MAPNLKVNFLALRDELHTVDASALATQEGPGGAKPVAEDALASTETQAETSATERKEEDEWKVDPQENPPPIDSGSYWDWPSDVPADLEQSQQKPNTIENNDTSAEQHTDETRTSDDDYWAERTHEEDIDSKFFIDYSREMGRGDKKGTVVRKAIDRNTGQRFAVKTCSKRKCQPQDVKHEAAMLMTCDHPNIVQCYGTYEDSKYLHIVTEYSRGGELYDRVIERAKKNPQAPCFSEPEAACILKQLLSAVVHCHSCGIVHRDLKLENILMVDKKSSKHNLKIKVIDFGLAARLNLNQNKSLLTDRVGTNYYVAPEVLTGSGYNEKCDLWAIGVIAYTLFSAKPPFQGVTMEDVYDSIQSQEVAFGGAAWEHVSPPAKEFIQACLQKDPKLRPSAQELLQRDWIQQQSARVGETKSNKRFLQRFKNALHLS